MNDRQDFRDRLLSAQTVAPELRERYQRRLESMYNRELTPAQRIGTWVLVAIGFVAVMICAYSAIFVESIDVEARAANAVIGLVVLAVTVLRARSAIIGSINLRWQPQAIAYTAFGLVLIGIMLVIFSGVDANLGSIYLLLVWLVVLVLVVTKLIQMQVQQSELKTQEKLLEIELRLVEMGEQMAKRSAE